MEVVVAALILLGTPNENIGSGAFSGASNIFFVILFCVNNDGNVVLVLIGTASVVAAGLEPFVTVVAKEVFGTSLLETG